MIETEQTVTIDRDIDTVWAYAHDMQKWAAIMPGFQTFTVKDENDSRWTLKVGAGGLIRTVNVQVHVDKWDGPENVDFSYKLEGDPVTGGGAYRAVRKGPNETQVTLKVQVVGSGPMAPLWEAMGKPMLPTFAKSFANQLKNKIEESSPAPTAAAEAPQAAAAAQSDAGERPGLIASFLRWLKSLFG
jgi:carbon monoxide dehydrogenase subunit G